MKLSYRDAIRESMREALRSDPTVLLIGIDIGKYGGTYAATRGLLEEFGPERVRDAPLSESSFVGAGIGAALNGLRPVVEIMTVNFSLLALDQIVNTAATLRHMSGGQLEVPLVIRMATGAGRQLAAQHSHSFENWFASVPGLRVVAPATVADARWMLAAALKERDPVILFEHVQNYGNEEELEPGPVSLDGAAIRRSGTDATIITYGGSLPRAMAAAEALAGQGISAEVIDLRSLRPLDTETITNSVTRTHRAVIVDEGWRTGSLAGEVAAILGERAFWELDAPIGRVCTAEVPIPYAKHLEIAALPSTEAVVSAVKAVMHA
ncbi:MAG TPA: alpha-ketoacid dehydrogenase subunit beta [Kofleriaceae bacterium]|nr:alpha-ketoacid dehydrogenase subunit beta [Kofleriaceae bacterium]